MQYHIVLVIFFFKTLCCVSGVLCNLFQVSLPQNIRVLKGSCVTIPCSFDVPSQYEVNLHENCEAKWVDKTEKTPRLTDTKAETGNLTMKNCTTTFYNMQSDHSNTYYFRLDCSNPLMATFKMAGVTITVTGMSYCLNKEASGIHRPHVCNKCMKD